jgi:hypothetical protein
LHCGPGNCRWVSNLTQAKNIFGKVAIKFIKEKGLFEEFKKYSQGR